MTEALASHGERRSARQSDRRRNSRSGRRANDPHVNWRRIAWLFGAYATLLSVRSVPATIKRFFGRKDTPAPT
jgi:hypothetical protein